LLETYNPKNCLRKFKDVNTIKKSIELKLPSIARFKKNIGEEKIEAIVKLWLVDLNNCLNLRRPMSEDNIDFISMSVVGDFGNLTFSDINLVFTRAKKGHYGELYESLNTAKVLGWFNEYFEERLNTAAEINLDKHNQMKSKEAGLRKEGDKNPLNLSVKDLNDLADGFNSKKS